MCKNNNNNSVTDLLTQLRERAAQVGKGRVIHDVPVEDIEFVHRHRFLCEQTK